jgi:hypothetical protein
MKLDILAFRHIRRCRVGMFGNDTKSGLRKKSWDCLTVEIGTRGSAEIRDQEANAAAKKGVFPLGKSRDARRFC